MVCFENVLVSIITDPVKEKSSHTGTSEEKTDSSHFIYIKAALAFGGYRVEISSQSTRDC